MRAARTSDSKAMLGALTASLMQAVSDLTFAIMSAKPYAVVSCAQLVSKRAHSLTDALPVSYKTNLFVLQKILAESADVLSRAKLQSIRDSLVLKISDLVEQITACVFKIEFDLGLDARRGSEDDTNSDTSMPSDFTSQSSVDNQSTPSIDESAQSVCPS